MFENIYQPATGCFLVAEPFMEDSNFKRTVVLLAEYNLQEGGFGFVINRPLDLTLNDVIEGLPTFAAPLLLGGPVDHNSLHFIHRYADLSGCRKIGNHTYWSGDFDHLCKKINNGQAKPEEIMFFIGYSGWTCPQLEQELRQKSWIVAPQNETFLFPTHHKTVWRDILRNMGNSFSVMANYPLDPRLN
ncbi:MAG: YqgE/AlgH family protein [Bacteroidia bacterium]